MNCPNKADFAEKRKRICEYLEQNGYEAMILARRDNFAWATCGGDNTVLRCTEEGVGILVFTREKTCLVARYMDADRIMEDELYGLDIEEICIKWFEDALLSRAVMVSGGKRIVSDVPCEGCDYRLDDIRKLHLPYTQWEVARWREVGAFFDRKFLKAANQMERGMTEQQMAAILASCFEEEFVSPVVLLVGGDERIGKYRHPLPSNYPVSQVAMVHLAGAKNGMFAAISRMISFGPVSEQLERNYDLLNQLQANAFARLIPGQRHGRVLEERQSFLEERGLRFEYDRHFPGGDIGYYLGSSAPFLEDRPVLDTMCYDIYLTLTGSKVEELTMAGPNGAEVLSQGFWPTKHYTAGSYGCDLPVILER